VAPVIPDELMLGHGSNVKVSFKTGSQGLKLAWVFTIYNDRFSCEPMLKRIHFRASLSRLGARSGAALGVGAIGF
jgi:hypothetical protein